MREGSFATRTAAAMAVLLGAWVLLVWGQASESVPGPCVVAHGPAIFRDIPETSGLAISRRDPALLWSHNDSGNAAVLFALDTQGVVRGRVRVPVETRDWEDVSAARCPSGDCLYIADIGDNRSARQRIQIYRVPEPAPGDPVTAPPEIFNASYADGPHNAEAMFVIGDELFIVTRDRVGGLYRATLTGTREPTFQRIGQLGLSAVTDAEASRDERSVVVRTSDEAVFYRTDDLKSGRSVPYLRIPLGGFREAQGEGVAFDGRMLYLSSEGTSAGAFLALRCSVALSNPE